MKFKNYSVLMAVYKNDNCEFLKTAIESIFNQTIKTNDFIIVVDGPIPNSINEYLNAIQKDYNYINLIHLKKNSGLGIALSIGVTQCKNNLIMRMDSDDVSLPNRAEYLLRLFVDNPQYSVVGSFVKEFNEKTTYSRIKINPISQKEIFNYSKFRNPMNHPSVMFKREAILRSGNYIEYKLNEDYFLWIRMLLNGELFYNTSKPLLNMRINNLTYFRRGGLNYFNEQNKIYLYMLKKKHINFFEFLGGVIVRFVFRVLIPSSIRGIIYSHLLRKKISK
jgi:glycosyltransferase involved in cell wall biosynthesis